MLSARSLARFGTGLLALLVFVTTLAWFNNLHNVKVGRLLATVSTDSVSKATFARGPYANTRFDGAGDLMDFAKPPLRISAMILAGREEYVSILNCYIQRNLVRNGGWLDEVLWIIRTDSESDKSYLRNLIDSTPEYVSWEPNKSDREYRSAYKLCRNDTIYVKIDDDVVFFEDHTIQAIVKRLVENPQFSVVSANIMNQPALAWVHYHMNTALAFAPELKPPLDFIDLDNAPETPLTSRVNWRPSTLPAWSGPKSYSPTFDMINAAPFKHHRWLPLPASHDIEQTPLGAHLGISSQLEYIANATAFKSWTMAAQQHYSFLTHLENNELHRYKFDLWHYHYERLSVNFIAFWGRDIIENGPVTGSDESWLTMVMPKKIKRPATLDGTAMVVHFGFHRQVYGHGGIKGKGLNDTDLIFRYKSFAEEFICQRPLGSPRP